MTVISLAGEGSILLSAVVSGRAYHSVSSGSLDADYGSMRAGWGRMNVSRFRESLSLLMCHVDLVDVWWVWVGESGRF